MAANYLVRDEKRLLEALTAHNVQFMIVGLTAAGLQGANVVTDDVDLWVKDLGSSHFLAAIQSVGGFYIPPGVAGQNPPMIGPDQLKVFDLVTHMHGLGSFEDEFSRSVEILIGGATVKVLPLDRIIASKEAAGRDKDRAALPALKAALAMNQKQ
ncbi:MAG: nucleotidyltransferase [Deltaproteobacteria bacterium]|nr:nucleotidyltransferase [Deltaproteobacteria bacterium]